MVDAWLHGLLLQSLTLSLAAVAVRVLQSTAMRHLGAVARYLCWLLVPVAMLAVALPHPPVEALAVRIDVAAIAPVLFAAVPVAGLPRSGGIASALVATWLGGALLLGATLMQRQRRFEALVAARADDTATPRLPAGSGPAVLGLWRRRIVLPLDFDSAFDAEERRLVLQHEHVHLRRADNVWNLLASTLLVLHWFNPLAWWAWGRVRIDQETSCDAAVLRQAPAAAWATYASALLKVQGVALAPPLATSWQSTHPLVERVQMLQVHRISSTRHRAGLRVAALAIVLAGCGGYALQAGASATPPASTATVMTAVEVRVDGRVALSARLLTQAGEATTLRVEPDARHPLGAPVEIAYTVTRRDGDRLQFDTVLRQGTPPTAIGSPRLLTHAGQAASVDVTTADGAHRLSVSFLPQVVSAAPPPLPPVPPMPAAAALPAPPPMAELPLLPVPPATAALPPLPALHKAVPARPTHVAEPPAPIQRLL